jgi:hypothetical protein
MRAGAKMDIIEPEPFIVQSFENDILSWGKFIHRIRSILPTIVINANFQVHI